MTGKNLDVDEENRNSKWKSFPGVSGCTRVYDNFMFKDRDQTW